MLLQGIQNLYQRFIINQRENILYVIREFFLAGLFGAASCYVVKYSLRQTLN